MTAEKYLVVKDLPGKLWIMPCPKAGMLDADIADYKACGIDTLVSLLPEAEMAALEISKEPQTCAEHGICFLSHPIVDFGLPEVRPFADLISRIAVLLRAGHSVAVHCRAGIGRSGMTTAGTLIALGYDSASAIVEVSGARGVAIPDTVEQGTFIASLANTLKCEG